MQGKTRKVVQAISYEIIAIILTAPVIAFGFDHSAGSSTLLAAVISTIALCWNVLFNYGFEYWEARRARRTRTLGRRVLHACGFEGGLALVLVPLMAWWLSISLWQAFLAELGLMLFFLLYAFCFQYLFDLLFDVPDSAREPPR